MPMVLREQARAKINLALHVLGRRADGMHELDSIVAFADFGDEIEAQIAGYDSLVITGPFAANLSAGDDNLVLRALHAVRQLLAHHGVTVPPLNIHLVKNLPVASGIGGGSADAAAILRLVLRATGANPPDTWPQMMKQLGADVPVCFQQKFCRMQGVGDRLEELSLPAHRDIVVVNPLKPCSTAAVFAALGLEAGQKHATALDPQQPELWRNDLTAPALRVEPTIKTVLHALRQTGESTRVEMSGSGASCYALFTDAATAELAAADVSRRHPGWWVQRGVLN